MSSILERLQGGSAIPWIPDPDDAAKYTKDCCSLNPLVGKAVDHYRRENFNGDGEYDVIVLSVDISGTMTDVAVHCQATVLANQMRSARPRGGEEVGVVYLGKKPSTRGQDYKDFKVVVDRVKEGEFDWAGSQFEPHPQQQEQLPVPQSQPVRAPVDMVVDDDSIPF